MQTIDSANAGLKRDFSEFLAKTILIEEGEIFKLVVGEETFVFQSNKELLINAEQLQEFLEAIFAKKYIVM